MKKIKESRIENYVLLVVLFLFVIFLLSKQGFFGSLFISCVNNEPKNLDEFINAVSKKGGVVSSTSSFIIQTSTELESYEAYISESSMGSLLVIPISGSCDSFLNKVNQNPFHESNLDLGRRSTVACVQGYAVVNNACRYNVCWPGNEDIVVYDSLAKCNAAIKSFSTNFMNVDRRKVLHTDIGYMFCNKNNNLAIVASDFDSFSSYLEEFETCGPVEPRQEEDPVEPPAQVVINQTSPVEEIEEEKSNLFNTVLIVLLLLSVGFLFYRKVMREKK